MKNRRQFLLAGGAAVVVPAVARAQEPDKIFLPLVLVNSTEVTRFGIIADIQMFAGSVAQMFPLLAARPLEFVAIAGDVMYVEPGNIDANWQWTVGQLNSLGYPWLAVPGNHDWGSAAAAPFPPARLEAVAAWAQYVGPTQFVRDLPYTRIVGLDYLDWTPENQAWITDQLQTEKRKIVVNHFPLTGTQPRLIVGESYSDWWDQYHAEKLAFFQAAGVSLFVSGHRHQFGIARVGQMTHVVCPAVANVVYDNQPEPAPDGIIPVTIPTRGWLEFEDRPETLLCELYRNDGKLLAAWAL